MNGRRTGMLGLGAILAACAACCAPLLLPLLASAGVAGGLGLTLTGKVGIAIVAASLVLLAGVAYRQRRSAMATASGGGCGGGCKASPGN